MFARSRGARIEMADVRPLRGLRYAPEAVKNLADVVTPPFDVISPEAQERYYARHPYNVIRLELGKLTPEDNALNNRYTRAARTLAAFSTTLRGEVDLNELSERLVEVVQETMQPAHVSLWLSKNTGRSKVNSEV